MWKLEQNKSRISIRKVSTGKKDYKKVLPYPDFVRLFHDLHTSEKCGTKWRMTRGSWLAEHLVGHYRDFVGLFNTCTPARCVEWQGVCNMVKFGMRKKIRNHPHLKTKKERRDLTNNAGQCPANKSSTAEFNTVPGRRALFHSSIASTKLAWM